jgi:hypothetical protein
VSLREEIIGVLATRPREQLTLQTRLDGTDCTTFVYAVPVLLTLDGEVRHALVDRTVPLPSLPPAVAAAFTEHLARTRIRSAGVHRFSLAGLVPLAGAYGNAYVTVRADADETIAVPDDPLPRRYPPAWALALIFTAALAGSYLLVRALS